MRTGIASIILGALAVLLITSAVISSFVSLHFMARQNTTAALRTLTEDAQRLEGLITTRCTQVDCDWIRLLSTVGRPTQAVFSRGFQRLAGLAPEHLNYRAAVQDAFTSHQVQTVTYTSPSGVMVAHVRAIVLLDQQTVVLLTFARVADISEGSERSHLIMLQVVNVILILAFGVYLMRRTVIGPIGELERWVRKRRASAAVDDAPSIKHPTEIARLRDAFSDLVHSLDRQQLVVQESTARLAQTQQQLAHRDRLVTVGRVASGIAHEVGNPLSSVIGFLSLLKEQPDFKTLGITEEEIIDRMDKELERVRKAVRQLLDLSSPVILQPRDMRYRSILIQVS